jgi:hypothetical protein
MGQRLRLKSNFVIPDNWSKHEKAVLRALKKYGGLVADNGNFLSISVAPDQRFPDNAFDHFRNVTVADFEVVQTTGPNEGPRSPGAPTANAGPDQTISVGTVATLAGTATFLPPAQIKWSVYSGPGTVTFGDASRPSTSVTVNAAGSYTLMLSVDDGVHAVAYDAVVLQAVAGLGLTISREGKNVVLTCTGGNALYRLETAESMTSPIWQVVKTVDSPIVTLPASSSAGFYRIRAVQP